MDNEQSFNKEFCGHLEYHLCSTFKKSGKEELKGFWCDGVSWSPLPDNQLTKKYVNDNRKVVTKAWIGKNGQDEYEMTILFGNHSLGRYAKGTSMIDCIPSDESMDWLEIDTIKRIITIRLR